MREWHKHLDECERCSRGDNCEVGDVLSAPKRATKKAYVRDTSVHPWRTKPLSKKSNRIAK